LLSYSRAPRTRPQRKFFVAEKKLRRKELKGPDEFQTATAEAFTWVQENRRPVTGVAAGLVIAIAAAALFNWWRASVDAKASSAFAQADEIYNFEIKPPSPQGTAADQPKPKYDFKDRGEQLRAALEKFEQVR